MATTRAEYEACIISNPERKSAVCALKTIADTKQRNADTVRQIYVSIEDVLIILPG
jgi:hypothetical protein